MITEVRIKDATNTPVRHFATVPSLVNGRVIPFEPGLNIIFGPNGSGKSALMQAIGRTLHCVQGGRTCVTSSSLQSVYERKETGDWRGSAKICKDGLEIVHDGQAVLFADPSTAIGLIGGLAGFDDDFFSQGVADLRAAVSSGQKTHHRLGPILKAIETGLWPDVQWKFHRTKIDHTGTHAVEAWVEAVLRGSIPAGLRTILLDEPEKNLSMSAQLHLWHDTLLKASKQYQIIAVSHSPFALGLPGVNYMDWVPGYLEECRAALRSIKGA